jgi:hypothetical protein
VRKAYANTDFQWKGKDDCPYVCPYQEKKKNKMEYFIQKVKIWILHKITKPIEVEEELGFNLIDIYQNEWDIQRSAKIKLANQIAKALLDNNLIEVLSYGDFQSRKQIWRSKIYVVEGYEE